MLYDHASDPCGPLQGKDVFLIRHAQGEHNVMVQYSYDPPLTAEGHKQVGMQSKPSDEYLKWCHYIGVQVYL